MGRRRWDTSTPAAPWLVVRDMFHATISHEHVPADPRASLRAKVEALRLEGWVIESPELRYDSTFANRAGVRVLVGLLPIDPTAPQAPGHSTDHYCGQHTFKN